MGGIALQELLNLNKIVLLSQLDGLVPLIEKDTAINSTLYITKLDECSYSGCAETHSLEAFSKVFKNLGVLRDYFNELLHVCEIFKLVISVGETFIVVR
jgi:hypothetical protein